MDGGRLQPGGGGSGVPRRPAAGRGRRVDGDDGVPAMGHESAASTSVLIAIKRTAVLWGGGFLFAGRRGRACPPGEAGGGAPTAAGPPPGPAPGMTILTL